MSYQVKLTREAEDDLLRLDDFMLEREIERSGGGDLALADRAIAAVHHGQRKSPASFNSSRRQLSFTG